MAKQRMLPDTKYGTPEKLLTWSLETKEPIEAKRFLGIRMLMMGSRREDVMSAFGITWSTLWKWVRLWNKGGRVFLKVGKPSGRHVLMVMDNASWHKSKGLNWGTVLPIYLPPYSPDLNPIEVLWKVIKDRLLDVMPPKNGEELQDRIQTVIRQLYNNPQEVMSICKVKY